MEAGIKAPSGHNLQTTSFIVVTDPQLRQHLASILPTKATKTAPAFIVALSEAKPSPGSNLCFAVEDYAAAVENILLAITAPVSYTHLTGQYWKRNNPAPHNTYPV